MFGCISGCAGKYRTCGETLPPILEGDEFGLHDRGSPLLTIATY
jgi:hypothetical protein